MKRIAFTIGALALVVSGCSSSSPDVAATVNGTEILESFVLSVRTTDEGAYTVSADQYRDDLSRLIFTEAMLSSAESDFSLSGLDTPEERESYLESLLPQERSYLETILEDPSLGEAAFDVVVTQLLLRARVKEALATDEESIKDVWENDRGLLTEVCVRHILVASEGAANEALQLLADGEDFGALADMVSFDTSSPGGVLPCPMSPSSFVEAFADATLEAPIGEVFGPVESEFGWHVLVVDQREGPASLEELSADPVKWMPADVVDSLWGAWINEVVVRAEIIVRSDIGTWSSAVNGIVPPPDSP